MKTLWVKNQTMIHEDPFAFSRFFKPGQGVVINYVSYTVLKSYLDSDGNQVVEVK